MIKRRILNKIDKPLFFTMIICLIFGLMMVGSASSLKSFMTKGDNYYYFFRQLFFVLTGLILFFIVIQTPTKRYNKLIYLGIITVIFGLVYVLLNQKVMNGIKGWLFIFGFGIQPSEFAKTILILFFAVYLEKISSSNSSNNVLKVFPFLIAGVFLFLIFEQPDLGTMVILFGITFMMYLLAPYDIKTKLVFAVFSLMSVVILILVMTFTSKGLSSMQKNRLNFTNPCSRYRQESGYQVCNGYIAINSGGLFGSGYGNSKQKYLYLPEAHTDFIFAIIIEEFGFVSGALILFMYFIVIWRTIKIGKKSYNIKGVIITYGVATYISLHVIINLGGVLGLIPLTGVPLPFYSYGGSFMWNLLICLGLVQRVSVENKLFEQKYLVR